jgi:excisionase family DNA binding protein
MANAPDSDIERLMRPEEVADVLGVTKRRLRQLVSAGALPCVRVGPQTPRFKRADVERLIGEAYEGVLAGDE